MTSKEKMCYIARDEQGYLSVFMPDGTPIPNQVELSLTSNLNEPTRAIISINVHVDI